MPIYEFECEECGTRFDRLVDAGTESVACEECGSERTVRRYSAAATFKLVKTPGDNRRQEVRNAALHKRTKDNFKAKRKAAREAKAARNKGGRDG